MAALAVLVHHIANETGAAFAKHGHLAVDYFLMLSGFVVAMSYEKRLREGMSFRAFAGVRVKRLYPMILLAAVLATALWCVRPNPDVKPVWVALQFLLIPAMASWVIFPLNAPLWSLFYEGIANAAHGGIIAFARDRTVAAIAAVLGVAAAAVVIARADYNWGFRPGEEWIALIRIFFAYLVGVLMWRLWSAGRLPRIAVHPLVPMALILLPLLAPAGWSEAWVGPLALFVCFPLAILCSLTATNERPGGIAAWLGGISYPLYAIHMPVIGAGKRLFEVQGALGWAMVALAAVLIAWAAELFYDAPIRGWLKRRSRREPARA